MRIAPDGPPLSVFLARLAVVFFLQSSDCFAFFYLYLCPHAYTFVSAVRADVCRYVQWHGAGGLPWVRLSQHKLPCPTVGEVKPSNRGVVTQGPDTAVAKGSFHA